MSTTTMRSGRAPSPNAPDLRDLTWEAVGHGNLAQLMQEHGAFEDAHARYERGATILQEVGDRRYIGRSSLEWGTLFHEEGRLSEALSRYAHALAVLREMGDQRLEGLTLACIASAEAGLGHDEGAEAGYAEAARILAAVGDPLACVILRVHRAYADVLAGRAAAAEEPMAAALPLSKASAEVRFALRLLGRALAAPARGTVRVGAQGRWFEAPGVSRVDLTGQEVPRLILLRLAEAHAKTPGEPLPIADLFSHGWPGERAIPSAMANRVRVTLHRLRKLGLRASIVRGADGWFLDPALHVVRDAPSPRLRAPATMQAGPGRYAA